VGGLGKEGEGASMGDMKNNLRWQVNFLHWLKINLLFISLLENLLQHHLTFAFVLVYA
jgi:hypothetical protein